jgi:hypothetical protein
MKAIPVKVIFHGKYSEHDLGIFPSIRNAKKVMAPIIGPYSLKRLSDDEKNEYLVDKK